MRLQAEQPAHSVEQQERSSVQSAGFTEKFRMAVKTLIASGALLLPASETHAKDPQNHVQEQYQDDEQEILKKIPNLPVIELIPYLDHDVFLIRQAAQRMLLERASKDIHDSKKPSTLINAFENFSNPEPEQKWRLKQLVEDIRDEEKRLAWDVDELTMFADHQTMPTKEFLAALQTITNGSLEAGYVDLPTIKLTANFPSRGSMWDMLQAARLSDGRRFKLFLREKERFQVFPQPGDNTFHVLPQPDDNSFQSSVSEGMYAQLTPSTSVDDCSEILFAYDTKKVELKEWKCVKSKVSPPELRGGFYIKKETGVQGEKLFIMLPEAKNPGEKMSLEIAVDFNGTSRLKEVPGDTTIRKTFLLENIPLPVRQNKKEEKEDVSDQSNIKKWIKYVPFP